MDILYLLIPLSALLVLAIVGVFAWATFSGQFEGLEREGSRILASDDAAVDAGQPVRGDSGKKLKDCDAKSP